MSQRGRFRTNVDDLEALLDEPHARRAGALGHRQERHDGHRDLRARRPHRRERGRRDGARLGAAPVHAQDLSDLPDVGDGRRRRRCATCSRTSRAARPSSPRRAAGGSDSRSGFRSGRTSGSKGVARFPGGRMWGEMKQNAAALTGHEDAGVVQLFGLFKTAMRAKLPRIRLHLIGHSAGAIVAQPPRRARHQAGPGRARRSRCSRRPCASTSSTSCSAGTSRSTRFACCIANLTDAAERSDDTCKPYGHSLLYLVSRSFEQHEETPLLGMERHLVPALVTRIAGATNVQQLRCPGGMWAGGSLATRATTHGGVDDDRGRAGCRRGVHSRLTDLRCFVACQRRRFTSPSSFLAVRVHSRRDFVTLRLPRACAARSPQPLACRARRFRRRAKRCRSSGLGSTRPVTAIAERGPGPVEAVIRTLVEHGGRVVDTWPRSDANDGAFGEIISAPDLERPLVRHDQPRAAGRARPAARTSSARCGSTGASASIS